MEIIKKIPFVISIFAFLNILVVKIIEYIKIIAGDSKLILKITSFIFYPKTPFYFNYWIVYIILAIIILIILALLRKYSAFQIAIGIIVNLVLLVIMIAYIINRM